MKKGNETADITDAESPKEASVDGNEMPEVPARDGSEFAVGLDGNPTTRGGEDIDPMPHYRSDVARGGLPECLFYPSEGPICSRILTQSWLDGQTTLQQAGQCIGAELQVAMLCMQKRLGKVAAIRRH